MTAGGTEFLWMGSVFCREKKIPYYPYNKNEGSEVNMIAKNKKFPYNGVVKEVPYGSSIRVTATCR